MEKKYLFEHEEKHLKSLEEISSECSLFLKLNKDYPIKDLSSVALYGNGVRYLVKGGTGSGDVDLHYFDNVEEAFEQENIKISLESKKWLDQYDEVYQKSFADLIKHIKAEAKKKKVPAAMLAVGEVVREPEYNLEINDKEDVAIYVLARNSGEGADRKDVTGDYRLTKTEINNILTLYKTHKKFLLVLNVSSPIDISPIMEVDNILLLSQLGSLTAKTLVDIVLGRKNPSGKLSTTWAELKDYPNYKEFGDINDTNYVEDIFVGYRYFVTFNVKPWFSFGYGKSYTDFAISYVSYQREKDHFYIKVEVSNIGTYSGKEVVQLYIKNSNNKFLNYALELASFKKTSDILPGQKETLDLEFSLRDFAHFDEEKDIYFIASGIYHLSVGNSSDNLTDIFSIEVKEDIVIRQVKHIDNKLNFNTLKPETTIKLKKLKENVVLTKDDFAETEVVQYFRYKIEVPQIIKNLNNKDLMCLVNGDIKTGLKSVVGDACSKVVGGAGETYLGAKEIKEYVSMCDGPAGLRISKEYMHYKNKDYRVVGDPLWRYLGNFLPKMIVKLIYDENHRKKKGELHFQYVTAIPVATALAQSFSSDVLYKVGEIVREEMEIYNVDLWLAPGMNIHRHILCGRNFEYYSEDPYLTGVCATSITKAIQKNPSKGVTIKHFACNNQEVNRMNSSSNLSIRALREIYLKGFEISIKEAASVALMASYNLINGKHTSESYYLINDILRNEFKYQGLVMTDWVAHGQTNDKTSKHASDNAVNNILDGTDLLMPGSKKDIKALETALKNKELSREDLESAASVVYQMIQKLKMNSVE